MRAAAGVLPLAASLSTPIVPTRIAATDTDRVVWSCAAILLIAFAPSLQPNFAMNAALYYLYLIFFLTHIPITLFVDSQAVLPAAWFPQAAKDMQAWYFKTHQDPLMMGLPTWFKSLVYSELALQLPFFFLASHAFLARANWIRIPAILYGSFVTATMLPILAELAAHTAPGYNAVVVTSFYLPYLLVPLTLALHMAATPQPFRATHKAKRR